MRSFAVLVGLMGLAFCRVANAACEAPFTMDDMLNGLTMVEDHLRNGNDADAGAAAKEMDGNLACLDAPLARMIAARLYRAIGAGNYAGGDTSRGMSWLITANEIEAGFVYGYDEMPEDHPVRFAFMDASDQSGGDRETMEGRDFVDGSVYLDAKKISSPAARPGRIHLLQHIADDGTVRGWLIEGAAFPEELLAAPAVAEAEPEDEKTPNEKPPKEPKPVKEPKEKAEKEPKVAAEDEPKVAAEKEPPPEKEPKAKKTKAPKVKTSEDGTYYSTPQWPAERVILVAGGSAIIAGSAAMYAMSAVSRGKFNDATTLSDVKDFKKQTNGLAVGSAAVGAIGAGTLGFGILFFIVDGQPVTGLQVRF